MFVVTISHNLKFEETLSCLISSWISERHFLALPSLIVLPKHRQGLRP